MRASRRSPRPSSSLSGETDYLVVGLSPGSTRDEAEDLGVEVLSEADFERLLGKG